MKMPGWAFEKQNAAFVIDSIANKRALKNLTEIDSNLVKNSVSKVAPRIILILSMQDESVKLNKNYFRLCKKQNK